MASSPPIFQSEKVFKHLITDPQQAFDPKLYFPHKSHKWQQQSHFYLYIVYGVGFNIQITACPPVKR